MNQIKQRSLLLKIHQYISENVVPEKEENIKSVISREVFKLAA